MVALSRSAMLDGTVADVKLLFANVSALLFAIAAPSLEKQFGGKEIGAKSTMKLLGLIVRANKSV